MDKIKELMVKSGVSEEAANQICESLNTYKDKLKTEYDEQFNARLKKAKHICLEETDAHKAELSRRVQIFLEAKSAAIEESLLRQSAQRETESVARLEKIASLVEGIEPNGQPCSELEAELGKTKRIAEQLIKERDHAVAKARKLGAISERVLKQNRSLERSLSEGVTSPAKSAKTQRIDEDRTGSQRRTLQPTIKENVGKTPPRPAQVSKRQTDTPRTPEEIASSMEEGV